MNKATKVAKVISVIDSKTAKVDFTYLVKHPVYGKYMKKNKHYLAHNEHGALVNDTVKIQHGKFSKRKTAQIIEIVQSAQQFKSGGAA